MRLLIQISLLLIVLTPLHGQYAFPAYIEGPGEDYFGQSRTAQSPSADWFRQNRPDIDPHQRHERTLPPRRHNNPNQTLTDSVELSWMRSYGANLVKGTARCNDGVLDDAGNFYVTGYAVQESGHHAGVTIKYNPDGSQAWIGSFSEDSLNISHGTALAVDTNGNAYVLATSYSSGISLSKYSSEGQGLWIVSSETPEDGQYLPTEIEIDGQGNIIITGDYWDRNGSDDEAVTRKYLPDGSQAWEARYSNPEGWSQCHSHKMVVDSLGNIYIGGDVDTGPVDYLIIKYSPDGAQEWVQQYSGDGNTEGGLKAIALDNSGNVYVTGSHRLVAGTLQSMVTIKYDSQGNEMWVASYGEELNYVRGYDLAVDSDGNVFVTGNGRHEVAPHEYEWTAVTVKYDSAGNEVWVNLEDDMGGSFIELDPNGNVIVTCNYTGPFTTIKYASNGSTIWNAEYSGAENPDDRVAALEVDESGNVFICGTSNVGSGSDITSIKYAPDGSEVWVDQHAAAFHSEDLVDALTLDDLGNIYLMGSSEGTDGNIAFITYKLFPNGDTSWVARYDGGTQYFPYSRLAVDFQGNVLIATITMNESGNDDITVIKYAPDGTQLWVSHYDGPGNGSDRPYALDASQDGGILISGSSIGINGERDYVTIKYTSDGIQDWVARYDGPASLGDGASDLVLDTDGNCIVTGASSRANGTYDLLTVKYAPDGSEIWVSRFEDPAGATTSAWCVDIDSEDNILAAGYSGSDYAIIKYNSDGEQLWMAIYDSPGNWIDDIWSLDLDHQNNILVTGRSYSTDWDSLNYVTIKYSPQGDQLWVNTTPVYHGSHFITSYPMIWNFPRLVIDQQGDSYLAGTVFSFDSVRNDIQSILKYSADGSEAWSAEIGVEYDKEFTFGLIGVDLEGNVYRSFSSGEGNNGSVISLVKYGQPDYPVVIDKSHLPDHFALDQNFPNPFNPTTTIGFSLPEALRTQLTIYNLWTSPGLVDTC
ncbi:MAG: SBBP repeat-containing protein [FCB group bacterium]|nr:SBBP repeat-containing protein [FCB group bacterium]MBL7029423.1 SBBP repeat-containing protein [Candidatus Neomarinimicrobiota bacterium]MBL7123147.1 SBBP repeat-containing protein [Candidatus Neomarinimicrobiota bacterium]